MTAQLRIEINAEVGDGFTEEACKGIAEKLRGELLAENIDATVEVEVELSITAFAGPPTCEGCWELIDDCGCDEPEDEEADD